MRTVCVYCASSTRIDPAYMEAARSLGTLLGGRGLRVVNGAGHMGLMGAVSDAALAAGGRVTGVIPRFMVDRGWHHTGLSELVVTEDMHERKRTMLRLADAVIGALRESHRDTEPAGVLRSPAGNVRPCR